jgi:murein DD-endopeptidase MepM/ murein hydrolase activator NlpD
MAKKYSVLIIDDKGSPVRESRISKRAIYLLICTAVVCISFIGIGAYHYLQLRNALVDKALLQSQLQDQQQQIEGQRKQIQLFAEDINQLKAKLINLNEFEQKIRIMANLEHKADQASLFAIGGSMPDDLDANLPLRQDHDQLIRLMHDHIGHVEQASAVEFTSLDSLLDSLKSKRNLLAATPSLRPTQGWISSNFGYRISPFTGRKEFHKGLDIATRKGTPIIAPADGVVTFAGNKWLMGNMVALDHGYGMLTRYGHCVKIIKKKGDHVKRGEVLALVGNTGRSTGPHLHYEIRLNGVPVNPLKYILD